mmetsp:Transcript_50387/g.113279  ORF Transcript_50387/g.113279 Transcript_50387/m.113279 type:complete len:231 (-) Transcript_50387:986-1678(-)
MGSSCELEAPLGRRCSELEVGGPRDVRAAVIVLQWEVGLKHPHRLLVGLLIGVILQCLDLLKAVCLLYVGDNGVLGQIHLLLLCLAYLENVLDGIQGNTDDLGVRDPQEVNHRLDTATLDKVFHLLGAATSCGIADAPGRLPLDVKVRVLKERDDGRDKAMVYDLLDLLPVPRRDVGDGPAALLANVFLLVRKQRLQWRQEPTLQYGLGLVIVAGDDIAHGSKRGRLHKS